MATSPEEWIKQADYDFSTALYMLDGGRYMYAVFMCHLAVEKALKAVWHKRMNEIPPRTHNLNLLSGKLALNPPEELGKFMTRLSEASISTRYPDELEELTAVYTKAVADEMIRQSRELITWIKAQL